MKKNVIQHVLPMAVLMVSTAMITACEKGGARTPEGAIARAQCERGLDTNVENQKLVQALSKNTNVQSDIAIRTYITKFDIKDSQQPSLLNPNNANIVSVQDTDVFTVGSDANEGTKSDAIVVTKDCKNLTASVKGPGFEIQNLKFKSAKLQSIELNRTDLSKNEDGSLKQEEISVKIEKEARLQAADLEIQKQIDDKSVKNKHLLKAALKSSKEANIARGNIVTKVTIDIKGSTTQSYVIEQHSGQLFDDARITLDKSVLNMIIDRMTSVTAPEFIKEALLASEAKSADEYAAKSVGINKLTGAEAQISFEQAKTFNEADLVTELREKLDKASGLVLAPKVGLSFDEKTPLQICTTPPLTPVEVTIDSPEKPTDSTLVQSEATQVVPAKK